MTSLFVGNLSKNISESKLVKIFKKIGPCKVDFKTSKGPYAFVEYDYFDDAKKALKELNKTNLQGANGTSLVRIEMSKKKTEEQLRSDSVESYKNKNEVVKEAKTNFKDNNTSVLNAKSNVCFVCKLPGHIAKDCLLTKEMCYECGEKGHIAKECKERVREAKVLTLNRVKAIRSQQSNFKFISPADKINNLLNHLRENK